MGHVRAGRDHIGGRGEEIGRGTRARLAEFGHDQARIPALHGLLLYRPGRNAGLYGYMNGRTELPRSGRAAPHVLRNALREHVLLQPLRLARRPFHHP